MTNNAKHRLIGIIAVIALGLIVTAPAVADNWIWDDFNDGNIDGWTDQWSPYQTSLTLVEEPDRGYVVQMELTDNAVRLIKDDYSFDMTHYIVEYDARVFNEGSGQKHIHYYQEIDNNDFAYDGPVWTSGPGSFYARNKVGGVMSAPNFSFPAGHSMDQWTRYKTERFEYGDGTGTTNITSLSHDDGTTWTEVYSYDHPNGVVPLGASFLMQFGGGAGTFQFDNISVTPEPATLSLLALGGLAMLRRRRIRVAY